MFLEHCIVFYNSWDVSGAIHNVRSVIFFFFNQNTPYLATLFQRFQTLNQFLLDK